MPPEASPALRATDRLALLGGLILAAALMAPIRGYLTDDTFIHLQYARNLAEGHGLVFNPGERVYGCTSPLWAALLAGAIALGLDGLATAHVLGAVLALLSVWLFHAWARRTLAAGPVVAAATIAWAGHAWMARWSVSGMETALAVTLTLGGFVALAGRSSPGARVVAGLSWALAALARPEAALLLVLGAGWMAREGLREARGRGALLAPLPGLAFYGAWLLFAWVYFGSAWPETLSAKTAGGGGIGAWAVSLGRQAQIIGATDAALGVVLVAALLARGAPRAHRSLAALAAAWVVVLPALYALRGVQVLSRYLLVILPALAWLAWWAAEAWWLGERERRAVAARAAWVVAALALIQNLAIYRLVVVPQVESFTGGLEQSLIRWGRWFASNAPPDAAIASPDIGAIGYFSRRRVIDLGGLVTPPMIPLLEREPLEVAVAEFRFASFARPLYLVDRAPESLDLKRRSRYGDCLEPLGTASVPNLGIARPGRVVYTFYRVDWDTYDRIEAARSGARACSEEDFFRWRRNFF